MKKISVSKNFGNSRPSASNLQKFFLFKRSSFSHNFLKIFFNNISIFFRLVGELGDWVNHHPEYLEGILNWLLYGKCCNYLVKISLMRMRVSYIFTRLHETSRDFTKLHETPQNSKRLHETPQDSMRPHKARIFPYYTFFILYFFRSPRAQVSLTSCKFIAQHLLPMPKTYDTSFRRIDAHFEFPRFISSKT